MTYRIEFVKQSAKQLKSLSTEEQQRIKIKIDALANVPRPDGVVKLSGEDNLYCIRVGNYRIIYSIQDIQLLVLVLKIGHRRDVYQ
ncbi:MAG: type II toxin-antitoxin system RelE family toxin [Pseudanabaena sp.]|jgi:mRNA interferase RelE/StbE|nr:type II toxin-antitoxin system RelE/ParE family toxin [Pseudanabaena sp. M109S1SP2A07QC]